MYGGLDGAGLWIMCVRVEEVVHTDKHKHTQLHTYVHTSDVVKRSVATKATRHQLTSAMFIIVMMNDDQILRGAEAEAEDEEEE